MTDLFTAWECPSNIALIKYWGKKPGQIPCNPSLSLTLKNAHTRTRIHAQPQQSRFPNVQVRFNGQESVQLATKITGWLQLISSELPVALSHSLFIETENSFPHGAGIASSASGMGALALGICDLQRQLLGTDFSEDFYRKASHIARLGSGSACRSIYGGWVVWGKTPSIPDTSDLYATQLPLPVHEVFQNWHNDILIVDEREKKVSSSAGHGLMKSNPFAEARFNQAREHLDAMLSVLERGNVEQFIQITESEALSLHAMMMTSRPSYLLLRPDTLHAIEKIREYREKSGIPICFTLDAGPNVHILYPAPAATSVKSFISEELLVSLGRARIIEDLNGTGPVYLGDSCP